MLPQMVRQVLAAERAVCLAVAGHPAAVGVLAVAGRLGAAEGQAAVERQAPADRQVLAGGQAPVGRQAPVAIRSRTAAATHRPPRMLLLKSCAPMAHRPIALTLR